MDYTHLKEAVNIRVDRGYLAALSIPSMEVKYDYGELGQRTRTLIAKGIVDRVLPTASGLAASGFRLACDTHKLIGVCSSRAGGTHLINFRNAEFNETVTATSQLLRDKAKEQRYRNYGYIPRSFTYVSNWYPGEWSYKYDYNISPDVMRNILNDHQPMQEDELDKRRELAARIREGNFAISIALENLRLG
jgi:hypothetical protein